MAVVYSCQWRQIVAPKTATPKTVYCAEHHQCRALCITNAGDTGNVHSFVRARGAQDHFALTFRRLGLTCCGPCPFQIISPQHLPRSAARPRAKALLVGQGRTLGKDPPTSAAPLPIWRGVSRCYSLISPKPCNTGRGASSERAFLPPQSAHKKSPLHSRSNGLSSPDVG